MKQVIRTEYAVYQAEAGIFSAIDKAKGLSAKAKNAAKEEFKTQVHHVADNLKITKDQAVLAFNEPKIGNILKACGYSFATAFGAFHMAHKVAQQGALHVIAHLGEHNLLHKLGHKAAHKHGHSIDRILAKYPVLKKLTGPALAGVILYGYTMTEPHKLGDWDLSSVKRAFAGEYGIADFLQSAEAVALSAHVISGKALSLTALAENTGTLALGLACTAIAHSEHPKLKLLGDGIKDVFAKFKPPAKSSVLDELQVKPETLKLAFESGDKQGKPVTNKGADKPNESESDAGGDWWASKSPESKKQYIKDHPNTTLKAESMNTLNKVTSRLITKATTDMNPKKSDLKNPDFTYAVILEAKEEDKLRLGIDCIRLSKMYARIPEVSAHVLPGRTSSFGFPLFVLVASSKTTMLSALKIYDPDAVEFNFRQVRKLPHA